MIDPRMIDEQDPYETVQSYNRTIVQSYNRTTGLFHLTDLLALAGVNDFV